MNLTEEKINGLSWKPSHNSSCAGQRMIQVGFRAISPSLHLPMWIIYVVFPIGFALDFIEVIRRIVVILKGWNDDESKEVAA